VLPISGARFLHALTGPQGPHTILAIKFPQLPRHIRKCLVNFRNAILITAHNSVRVRIGGLGVEPLVRANFRLAPVGGIKVRIG